MHATVRTQAASVVAFAGRILWYFSPESFLRETVWRAVSLPFPQFF